MTDQKIIRKAPRKRSADTAALQTYLETLGTVNPSIHINGPAFPTAIITVDLGAPMAPAQLSQDQAQELITRLRRTTRDLFKEEVNIRVSSDHHNGIFWSSIA